MPDTTITIIEGNSDGTLVLSDGGYSPVDQFTRITWDIHPSSKNVASIDKIHKKKDNPIIFILGPSRDGKNWTGKVMFAPKKDYEYYIEWTDITGVSRTHDPKISVNPSQLFRRRNRK